MQQWIWQQKKWPGFTWDEGGLSPLLSRARKQQGQLLGMARLLDNSLSLEAQAQILTEDGFNTSAIEGERLDMDSIRSSVARHLGLPTAGLPHPSRSVDGLVDVLLDATREYAGILLLCGRFTGVLSGNYPGNYNRGITEDRLLCPRGG